MYVLRDLNKPTYQTLMENAHCPSEEHIYIRDPKNQTYKENNGTAEQQMCCKPPTTKSDLNLRTHLQVWQYQSNLHSIHTTFIQVGFGAYFGKKVHFYFEL